MEEDLKESDIFRGAIINMEQKYTEDKNRFTFSNIITRCFENFFHFFSCKSTLFHIPALKYLWCKFLSDLFFLIMQECN